MAVSKREVVTARHLYALVDYAFCISFSGTPFRMNMNEVELDTLMWTPTTLMNRRRTGLFEKVIEY
jgi:hypothetical protein